MKKLFIGLIIVVVVVPIIAIVGLRLGWASFIEPKVRAMIVSSANEQGYQLSLQPISLNSWWFPIEMHITQLELKNIEQGVDAKIPFMGVVFSPTNWTIDPQDMGGHVTVTLQKPQITITKRVETKPKKQVEPSQQKIEQPGSGLPPLSFSLKLSKGQVVFNQETPNGFNQVALLDAQGSLNIPQLMAKEMGALNLNGNLVYKIVSGPVPLQGGTPLELQTKTLSLSRDGLSFNPLTLDMGGLAAAIQGKMGGLNQQWRVKAKVDKLSDLQKGGLLPEGAWKGGLEADLSFDQNKDRAPIIAGVLSFQKVSGVFKRPIERQKARISGGFAVQGDIDFRYQKQLQKLKSNLAANLTAMSLLKADQFYKKAGVPLTLSLQSDLKGDKIHLSALKIQLAQIKGQIDGVLSPIGGDSRLNIMVDKTSLSGLEDIFLMMKKYPVKGHLALKARLVGDLTKPDKLNVEVNPIDLQISSGLTLKDQGKGYQVSGPFKGKIKGQLQVANRNVLKANLVGEIDLNQMSIKIRNGLEKKPNQNLNLVFNGGKKGDLFNFSQFFVKTFLGSFNAKGSLSNPLKPNMNISGKIMNLNLAALKTWMNTLKDLPLTGFVNGSLKLQGRYDAELGIEKSPLLLSGEMLHNSSSLKWTSPITDGDVNETDKKELTKKTKVAAQPLLPDWPILKNARVTVVSNVKKVIFNDLTVTDFELDGRYNQGVLTGKISMQRLFSGSFLLKDLRSDLYQVPTYIEGTAVTKGLNLEKAVTWGVPAQKDLLKGSLTGGFRLKTPFPSHADPLQNTQSSGAMEIKGFEVSTMKLDNLINGILNKIPGLKNKKRVKTKDVKALFKTNYSFKKGVLSYSKTNFLTPENHQLLANGTFHLDKSIYLKGDLFVSGVKVKERLQGCLLDSQGRLEVPVEYTGSIVNPKLANASQAIEKIGGRYLECEKKSQVKKVKAEVKKEADKLLKNEGKNLEDKIKDKLKDFF